MWLPWPGLEPRSHEWESITLTTILPKNKYSSYFLNHKSTSYNYLHHISTSCVPTLHSYIIYLHHIALRLHDLYVGNPRYSEWIAEPTWHIISLQHITIVLTLVLCLRGYSSQTHFFYYWDINIIYNLYPDMCTYSLLRKQNLASLEFDFRFDLLHSDSKQYVHVYSSKI